MVDSWGQPNSIEPTGIPEDTAPQEVLNHEELEEFKKIVELYNVYKPIILGFEEKSTDTFAPALTNLRDSYDHLMRVFSIKFNIQSPYSETADKGQIPGYTQTNLRSAYGHLYRATYDVLDYLGIELRIELAKVLDGVSSEAIATVIPDYYTKIKIDFTAAEELFAECRDKKDMGYVNFDDIGKYVDCINILEGHLRNVTNKIPGIVDFDQRKRESEQREGRRDLGLVILGGIITLVGSVLIKLLFG